MFCMSECDDLSSLSVGYHPTIWNPGKIIDSEGCAWDLLEKQMLLSICFPHAVTQKKAFSEIFFPPVELGCFMVTHSVSFSRFIFLYPTGIFHCMF